jgi:exonuclease III
MEDQIDTEAFKEAGYEYQYYYSARKGYSGTTLFLRSAQSCRIRHRNPCNMRAAIVQI